MPSILVTAPRLIAAGEPHGSGSRLLSPGFVRFENGTVTDVGAGAPPGPPDVELPAGVLVPGLVDLQVNGYFGHDLVDADANGWAEVVRRLPETGVTAFLPTFITAPVAELAAALNRCRSMLPGLPDGARVLGVHVEGPFLSARRAGAHDASLLTDPVPEALDALLAPGVVRLVTLAPERAGAPAAIRRLAGAGVLVSVGHSDATADEVRLAAEAGARMVTHVFNAQSGVHHRDPGVAAQALIDPALSPGLIIDLHHVAPAVCRLVFAAAGHRTVLVTDAASAAGMPPGRYDLGGQAIELPADGPPLRADGTIAGSALRLDAAVANAVGLGVPLADAIDAASRRPADLIGHPELGRIAPGAAADLAWLGDDLRTRAAWVGGRRVFGTEP